MKMKLAATAICLGLFAIPAAADGFRAALRQCEEQAAARMESSRHSSATSAAIGGAANILGAVIAGQNPAWALPNPRLRDVWLQSVVRS